MNRTIIITGSSSGIGNATVKYFAVRGWNIIATMRSPEKEIELIKMKNVFVTKLDVQDQDTIESAIKMGLDKFGKIDVVVNNAGYTEFGLFEAMSEEQVISQFDINVFGVMKMIRSILPHFRENKNGMIINIGSVVGRFTLPLSSLYAASKSALEGFSESLSFELSALDILVKIIEPGETAINLSNISNVKGIAKHLPDEYEDFIAAADRMIRILRGCRRLSAEQVASVIYEAATDGKDTLRYTVGGGNFREHIDARGIMNDQDFYNLIN